MNYQKLDAALAIALKDIQNPEERCLVIFIHTEPIQDTTASFLERLGVSGVTTGKNMFTATLSASAVSQLSDQPWVKYLKLSQKLRLLDV